MAHKDAHEPPATERSLRNPRRRNRVESESIKVAPRRKRSKITETTFLPRDSPDESAEDDARPNGHAPSSVPRSSLRQTSMSIASGDIDLPVRGARNSIKRTARVDGARVLTQNENYSVKLLSSTPKELQGSGSGFRGSISLSTGLALAITKEKAYIWDYNGHTGATNTKSIEIPFSSGQHDPLPFGTFVANSGSNDLGLLLISASSGNIVYHESIERVTSLGFFQERRGGIEGSISGLFSGEKLVQLVSADPAGYVALLSSGRAIHIALRDAQGKPKISTQVLYTNEQAAGGLFGSIKNILGSGAWKQAVSAVRVRPLERGQVQVLGLMEKGELRIWDLDWSGRYDFRAAIDFREQLQHELRQMRPAERQGDVDHLTLLDIAVIDRSHHSSKELVTAASGKPMDALLLVRCGAQGMHSYALVEFTLTGNNFNLARILDVSVESQTEVDSHQARVFVPAPGHTAFVVLADSVAILSLAIAASNPEAQLHDASYIEPTPFQDAIYLRQDRGLAFSGGEAESSKHATDASAVVFVDGAGLVRIVTHDVQIESVDVESAVKSNIEQAVFYGYQENNLLDLLRARHKRALEEHIEQAVVSISEAILHSSSRFFDSPPTSVAGNLQSRLEAAAHLAAYIRRAHPRLSSSIKWQLLTDAEKLAAGGKLWELFESHLNKTVKGKRKSALLNEVCEIIQTRYPFDSLWPQNSSDDVVRTFFVTQLAHIGRLLPWTRRILESIHNENERPPKEILRLVSEADDIWLRCLQTAWTFRNDHAQRYGLSSNVAEYGSSHKLPELWTSSDEVLKDADKMIDLSRTTVQDVFDEEMHTKPDGDVIKIAKDNPALVDLMCQVYIERIAWCESQGTDKYISQARRLQGALEIKRHEEIRQLAEVGQVEASIELAEKYQDMQTLTEVLIAEAQYLQEAMGIAGQADLIGMEARVEEIFQQTTEYFNRFGDPFAEAFFNEAFSHGNGYRMILESNDRWREPMTRWLRKDPSRAKICWFNDILHGGDYKHASTCLFNVAMDREENNWNKKVELSLAKLSMNAFFEDKSHEERQDAINSNVAIDDELMVVDVQDRLYQHVIPITMHSLDAETRVQTAMEAFFGPLLAFKTWYQVLSESMARLLEHRSLKLEELLDLISLAESRETTFSDLQEERTETFEALVALSASQHCKPGRLELLTKLCWKRAYLKENWEKLNAIKGSEEDIQAALAKTSMFRAFRAVLSAKFQVSEARMAILEPLETLGAGCHIDDIPSYVSDEIRESMLEENIIMERQLEAMIREQNIESWVRDALRLAKKNIFAGAANGDPNLAWAHEEHTNGHLANGHVNGIKREHEEDSHGLAAIAQAPEEISML